MVSDGHWSGDVHHDGSELYVSDPAPALGETVEVRIRLPAAASARAVYVRSAPDGEEHMQPMEMTGVDGSSAWWSGPLKVHMPLTAYRFLVMGPDGAYWISAKGASLANRPDWGDFKLVAGLEAPDWLDDRVFYQIFPDRFYNGDPVNDVRDGEWARGKDRTRQMQWGDSPVPAREGGNLDFFGGDLQGITQKLDYLDDLGVNGLYLNPIFTAYTNHRYDIADYLNVDPHLGGNAALLALRDETKRRGMRLLLDVTPNHCGDRNGWFTAAQADERAVTAEYFTFHRHPDEYESWLGHRSLVKLNYRSQRLRDAMYRAPGSVMQHWLAEPYRADGWRLDVANMTARQGSVQLAHEVWRELRRSVKGRFPQAYLMGEISYDGTPHLQGDELDAIMNYQGFCVPLWSWLHPSGLSDDVSHLMPWLDQNPLPAEALAEQWMSYQAAVPWAVTRQQFNQLGSHDTPRILWMAQGEKALVRLAAVLLMTFPGMPCVYYGDEIGLGGTFDPDNRRCMPWDETDWDQDLRAHYQRLIRLRREAPALRRGGFQMLAAEGGLIAYQRQSREQRLLVVGWRGPGRLADARISARKAGLTDGTQLRDLLSEGSFTVRDGQLRLEGLEMGTTVVLEAES